MFRNLIRFLILIFIITHVSCADDPVACFETDPETAFINQNISFTNCSTNSDQYHWEFGDSVISTDIHPIHAYSDTGIFIVELKAFSNFYGKDNSIIKSIKINDPSSVYTGNYLTEWQGNNSLLYIQKGLSNSSVLFYLDSKLFCNGISYSDSIIINSQNYWNDDFLFISRGIGVLSGTMLEINLIVTDSLLNETIINISAEKLAI